MKHRWITLSLGGVLLAGVAAGAVLGQGPATNHTNASSSAISTRPEDPGSGPIAGNAAKNSTGTTGPDTDPTLVRLTSGTLLVAELTRSLNARKLQPGDRVTARLIQAVVLNGKVVLPRGAKLVGNVTETKARSKQDPESRIGIVFAKAIPKDGRKLTLDAVVQALAPAQPSRVDRADPMLPPQVGPANASSGPQPLGGPRSGSGGLRGAPATSPAPNLSATLDSQVAAGTTPNAKEALSENGTLNAGSKGIFGLPGLTLRFTGGSQVPVITSVREDVKLESGTQMALKVTGPPR